MLQKKGQNSYRSHKSQAYKKHQRIEKQATIYKKIMNYSYIYTISSQSYPNPVYDLIEKDSNFILNIKQENSYSTINKAYKYHNSNGLYHLIHLAIDPKTDNKIVEHHISVPNRIYKNNDKRVLKKFKTMAHYTACYIDVRIYVYISLCHKDYNENNYFISIKSNTITLSNHQQDQLKHSAHLYMQPLLLKVLKEMEKRISKLREPLQKIITRDSEDVQKLEKLKNFVADRSELVKLYNSHIQDYEQYFLIQYIKEMVRFKAVIKLYQDNKNRIDDMIKDLQAKKTNSLKTSSQEYSNNKRKSKKSTKAKKIAKDKKVSRYYNNDRTNSLYIEKLFSQQQILKYQLNTILDELWNHAVDDNINLFKKNIKLIFNLKKKIVMKLYLGCWLIKIIRFPI